MRIAVFVLAILAPALAKAQQFLYSPLSEITVTCDFCGYLNLNGSCHGGIDIRARDPLNVVTADAGTVVRVIDGRPNTYYVDPERRRREYGNIVEILHPNGYSTIYAHLLSGSLTVQIDDEVEHGQRLGITGNSGWSTAPHLHFEVRDPDGRRVDPYGMGRDDTRCAGGFTLECGENLLWTTCPPVPWEEGFDDSDSDDWTVSEGDCLDEGMTPEGVPASAVHPGAEAVNTCFCIDLLQNNSFS